MTSEESDSTGKNDETDRLFGFNLSPKCTKRQGPDETLYGKSDLTDQNIDSAKDPTTLRSLVHTALKIKPFIRYNPPKKPLNSRHLAFKKQIERLKDVQIGINQAQQELKNAVFFEGFKLLDQLRPLFTKRFCVILGEFLPELSDTIVSDVALQNSVKEKLAQVSLTKDSSFCQVWKDFWIGAMDHCLPLAMTNYPWDRDILSYLIDIRCTSLTDPPAFSLDFMFSDNPYFTNSTLSRQFEFKRVPADELRNRPEHYPPATCTGCVIHWLPGKDVTTRTQLATDISADLIKTMDKPEVIYPIRSFFNFFNPLVLRNPELVSLGDWKGTEPQKNDLQAAFNLDFHIGNVIRLKLIPHAVDFYLGTSRRPLYVALSPSETQYHPARKAAYLDISRLWTGEELEKTENLWLKKDENCVGEPEETDQQLEREIDSHIRRGVELLGYRVWQGRAYRRDDNVPTSDDSQYVSSLNEAVDVAKLKKSRHGPLEVNASKRKRRYGGIMLSELRSVVEKPASDDDQASLYDLRSESGDSFNSDIELLCGLPREDREYRQKDAFGKRN